MKVKIIGKKHINCDSYDKLSIQKFHDILEIKASTREKQEYYRDEKVLDQIRGQNEEELIAYLINYYLDNNDISDINYKKDLMCKSVDDRLLCFKSYASSFSKDFIKKIYQLMLCKYIDDRNYFIENVKFSNIDIQLKDGNSSYKVDENSDILNLTISISNKKIESYEEDFLKKFILNILMSSNDKIEIINYKWNEFKMSIPCFQIKVGDTFINLDKNNEDLKRIVMDSIKYYENINERRK